MMRLRLEPVVRHAARGFTLLEMLVAVSIIAVISSIVYISLVSVTQSTEMARADTEKLRLQRYLRKELKDVLATVYTDAACLQQDYAFVGIDETGPRGPRDSLAFCSTAPMRGNMALPGMLKRVTIEVADKGSEQTLEDLDLPEEGAEDDAEEWDSLRVTEKPLVVAPDPAIGGMNLSQMAAQGGAVGAVAAAASAAMESAMDEAAEALGIEYESPAWTVPIQSVDITYFDGEEWIDTWDSLAIGHLPWSIRVRLNFARTDEELEADRKEGIDIEEDPDFDLIVPIPLGSGVISEYLEEDMNAKADRTGGETESESGDEASGSSDGSDASSDKPSKPSKPTSRTSPTARTGEVEDHRSQPADWGIR